MVGTPLWRQTVGTKRWRHAARYGLVIGILFGGVSGAHAANEGQARAGRAVAPSRGKPGMSVRGKPGAAVRPGHRRAAIPARRGATIIVLLPPSALYAASPPQGSSAAPARRRTAIAPGLAPARQKAACPSAQVARVYHMTRKASSFPATVDLSDNDPPVADEGPVHAGAAWATGYTLLGWWANKVGLTDGPFAPMSVYAQLTRGRNRPVALSDALALEQRRGIATQAGYPHGRTDFRHMPSRAERANAAHYRLAGYSCVYAQGHSRFPAQTAIRSVLAAGQPVVLDVPVYDNFLGASVAMPYVDLPASRSKVHGAEAVVAVKYDGNGVWVENQWGEAWGLHGYAELSWRFVNRYVQEAWIVGVRWSVSAGVVIAVTATPAAGRKALPVASGTPATAYAYPLTGTVPLLPPCPSGVAPSPTGTAQSATASATPGPADTLTPITSTNPPSETLPPGAACTTAPFTTRPYSGTAVTAPYTATTGFPDPTATSSFGNDTGPYPTGLGTAGPGNQYPYPGTPAPATATPTPGVRVNPTSGAPGTTVVVSGNGFVYGAVLVFWDGALVGTAFSDGASFAFTTTVPASSGGPVTVSAVNAVSGNFGKTTFTVIGAAATATNTATPTPTNTPTPTPTNTPTPTPTSTATSTATPTATNTARPTATNTAKPTSTP